MCIMSAMMMTNTKKRMVLVAALGALGAEAAVWGDNTAPRNFIMVIPDGFGPASETMARDWVHWNDNATVGLPIDEMMMGQIRTRSSDSYVTDSASSATAYSCGLKTYNGGIGVSDDIEPCGTVLEAAKMMGYKTGLIVTSRITHATPASYSSHVYDRDHEANIALQQIGETHPLGPTVDILLGGGRCFFTPQSTPKSCRTDDIDGLEIARKRGYSVFTDREGFEVKGRKMPYMGLFTESHMSFEVDRVAEKEPSLTEMAIRGLDDLEEASRGEEKGFFVMVEASRIDHAGHFNDPTSHLHDILEYNRAMAAMRSWIDSHSKNPTVLISTADHECGGLSLGFKLDTAPGYYWAPEHFKSSKASTDVLSKAWKTYKPTSESDAKMYLRENVFGRYGVMSPSADEITQGLALKNNTSSMIVFLGHTLSKRLGVNWAYTGHTGVDVTLYGHGPSAATFAGQHENMEVGQFVAKQLGLDLNAVTAKLRANRTFVDGLVKPQEGEGMVKKRWVGGHHN